MFFLQNLHSQEDALNKVVTKLENTKVDEKSKLEYKDNIQYEVIVRYDIIKYCRQKLSQTIRLTETQS